MPPLSIPARTFRLIPAKAYDGKITQAKIPPPPPYHASVRNAVHRNEINHITQIQQSCSTNVFTSSSVTTNINAVNASTSAVFVDQNSMKQPTDTNTRNVISATEPEQLQIGEIITADEFDFQNEVSGQSGLKSSANGFGTDNGKLHMRSVTTNASQKQKTKNRSNAEPIAETTTATVAPSSTTKETKSVATTTAPGKELRNSVKQEVSDSTAMEVESVSEKRAYGLKVLSNVQVSPNAILNVSVNKKANEANSSNNMIIVSSLPSTSTGTTTSQHQQTLLPQLTKPQSLLKNLNESRTLSDTRNTKNTKGNTEVSITNIIISLAIKISKNDICLFTLIEFYNFKFFH